MRNLVLALSALLSASSYASSSTCTATIPNSYVSTVLFGETRADGTIPITINRADRTSVSGNILAGAKSDDSEGNSFTLPITLDPGTARVLKRTGAYTNVETYQVKITLSPVATKTELLVGRSCDPYYQEEEGCIDENEPLLVAQLTLSCTH